MWNAIMCVHLPLSRPWWQPVNLAVQKCFNIPSDHTNEILVINNSMRFPAIDNGLFIERKPNFALHMPRIKGSSYLLSLIYLTSESGSLVVGQLLDTQRSQAWSPLRLNFSRTFKLVGNGIAMHSWKINYLIQTLDVFMDRIFRFLAGSFDPLQPLYVDSWASLHVNIIVRMREPWEFSDVDPIDQCIGSLDLVFFKSWFLIKICTVWSMNFAVHMLGKDLHTSYRWSTWQPSLVAQW